MDLHNGLDIEVYDLVELIYTTTTTTTTTHKHTMMFANRMVFRTYQITS